MACKLCSTLLETVNVNSKKISKLNVKIIKQDHCWVFKPPLMEKRNIGVQMKEYRIMRS